MTNPTRNKRHGASKEIDAMKHLREQGIPAERLRLNGVEDEGDLWAAGHVIEVKATKQLDSAGFLREAAREAINYAEHRGVAVPPHVVLWVPPRKQVGQWVVLQPFAQWIEHRHG